MRKNLHYRILFCQIIDEFNLYIYIYRNLFKIFFLDKI